MPKIVHRVVGPGVRQARATFAASNMHVQMTELSLSVGRM